MPRENEKTSTLEKLRLQFAFALSVVGLLLAAILAIVLVFKEQWAATDTVALVGLFTSVLGTLVGAFFGVQVGLAGREEERQDLRDTRAHLEEALTLLPEDKGGQLRQHWFKG